MSITPVLNQILMLMLIMLIGLLLRKRDILGDQGMKAINTIVLSVAWPAMVLSLTQREGERIASQDFLWMLLVSGLVFFVGSLAVFFLYARKLPERKQAVYAALCGMPNTGFVGLPIVQAAYGAQGVLYLTACIVSFNLVWWTLFVRLFGGRAKLSQLLKNIGLMASVAAGFLYVYQIKIPEPFVSTVHQLGVLNTPLTMLLLGARLPELWPPQMLRDQHMWSSLGVRLVGMPLIVSVLLRLLGISGLPLQVLTLVCALPCANSVQLFAEKYGKDYALASKAISLSLLLCVVTIPLVMLVTGI